MQTQYIPTLRTHPIRKAQDLAQAAELLAAAAEREGYRIAAVHPLFQYAGEGYNGPNVVTLELDAPKLNQGLLCIKPEIGLFLPIRITLFEKSGLLCVAVPEVNLYSRLLDEPSPEAQRVLDWMEVTQDILVRTLTG